MSQESTPEEAAPPPTASRRVVLASAGAAAVAVLGGCATYGQSSGNPPDDDPPEEPEPSDGGTPKPLAQTSDIPVGGGTVFDQRRVVVTQPQAGTFKAYTAVCTHQGCVVAEVKNGEILCPCHGSKFKIADGAVAAGPASRPLRAIDLKVTGTDITLA